VGGAPKERWSSTTAGRSMAHQLRCLPIIRTILSRVQDENHIPLELHRFLAGDRIEFRGNLPLDDEAGSKLVLLFKLQERMRDLDRVELIARGSSGSRAKRQDTGSAG